MRLIPPFVAEMAVIVVPGITWFVIGQLHAGSIVAEASIAAALGLLIMAWMLYVFTVGIQLTVTELLLSPPGRRVRVTDVLEEARKAGILRSVGGIYHFVHRDQERALATRGHGEDAGASARKTSAS